MPAFLLGFAAQFSALPFNGGSMQGYFLKATFCLVLVTAASLQNRTTFADQDLAREPLPTVWQADAELTDVFFLNADLGWAVGAQGVILRTTDGGDNWHEISQVVEPIANDLPLDLKIRNMRNGIRTRSTGIANGNSADQPVRCRFESVHFVDEMFGWIAGGYEVPYVGRSRAVILRTKDGGVTWEAVENLVIPRITRIKFTDPINGWAIGQTGNLFQDGIFYTSDGGQSWSSQSSSKTTGFTDAEKTDTGFVALGQTGRPGVVSANSYEASVILTKNVDRISQLRMANHQSGWAVGENGTLLQTDNGGLSWSPVDMSRIKNLVAAFDFASLSITRQKIWFAGDPGTFLFSLDRSTGMTTSHRTPVNARINHVHFVDDQTGWAVGASGTIIATVDGGQSWKVQRSGNRRAAILCVASNNQSLPFEVLSKYAIEDSRICASLVLEGSNEQNRVAIQALDRLGSTTAFSIEARPPTSEAADAEAHRQKVLKKLVRVLRTQQPNVIVCNFGHALSPTSAALSPKTVTLIEDAIRLAANRNGFPQQIEAAGLKTWQVDRLAVLDPTGTVVIDPHRLLPRSGVLIEDQISISRALVGQPICVNQIPKYRVSHFTGRNRIKAGDLLSGLGTSDSIPSRSDENSKRGNLNMIQQANAKQKKFEQFIQFEANTPHDLLVWRQQIQSFTMPMDRNVAGTWLMQMADRYLVAGKTELAANSAILLVTYWPDHAFAPACLTWLAQYYASDEFGQIEFRKRIKSGQLKKNGELTRSERTRHQFETAPRTIQQNGVSHLVWTPTQSLPDPNGTNDYESQVKLASHEEPTIVARPAHFDDRLKLASHFLSQLAQRDPELIAGSQYQLLKAQLSRRINGILANEGRFNGLVQKREFDGEGISIGAQRELGLNGLLAATADPLRMLNCRKSDQRPRLDGKLDDPCWQSAIDSEHLVLPTVQLPGVERFKDVVLFAYDDQFFYAGFTCHKIQGQHYNARKQARPRDADLSRRDRVELVIDLDRDYRSTNHFVIDHRGWVSENCTGSLGWNPDWYVSQAENETTWTVEIAIPLDQMIPGTIEPGTTWAFQVARRADQEQDIWNRSAANQSKTRPSIQTGLQMGLLSRPADFELIRFIETDESIVSR